MAKKSKPTEVEKQPSKRLFRVGRVARTLLLYVLLALSALIYTATVFKRKEFGDSQIEEMLFLFFNGFAGGNTADVLGMIYDNLMLFCIMFFLFLLPVVDFYRNKISLRFNLSLFGKNKTVSFNPSKIPWWIKFVYTLIVLGATTWFMMVSFQVPAYLRSMSESSQIFEEHYVDPKSVTLSFPEKKQNLVFIYLESMENTLASIEAGGQKEQSLIPELEKIALDKENISFSHSLSGLGGAQPVVGTTWTAASMTAQSLGVPIKPNFTGVGGNDYGKLNQFFPGTYGIGEVLAAEGYNQSFIMGSEQTFGGRDKLLGQHGGYNVLDHKKARETGRIPDNYQVWWGYEDKKLFSYAKEEATRLAAQDEPFNLSMLTVDTHFVDGYLDPSCPATYQRQYDNVYACSSAQVAEFVSWVQSQPFADETTIIIVGDHLGMQQSYYDEFVTTPSYQRTTYNAIINSATPLLEKRPRQFAAFDMYPTTLAALGVNIPGDRLGMGTNLFAQNKETLLEQYGSVDALDTELSKRSQLYDQKILTGIE
ncbi:MAG: LTA synthase family protein [Candidatus Saccharimonadales bacterium]